MRILQTNRYSVKRKRNSDDVDMDLSSSSSGHAIASSPHTGTKRVRNLPIGRPLPLSRLLEDLDKTGLQDLVKSLCERHPGMSNEVYKHAPKPTVPKALSTLARLERNVQNAFPFGGDTKGEYAYNRVLPHIKELLNSLMDYVPHFLPPNEEHALETFQFLDGATAMISRLPDWNNENHSLAKREAYEELNGAWIQGFKEASKKGAGVGAVPYVHKLRQWNELSGGSLEAAVIAANEELGWTTVADSRCTTQDPFMVSKLHPLQGLFSR